MVMQTPRLDLLFVRYAPGAAGNFLIAMLQTSDQLDCWNQQVEKSKNTDQFELQFKSWFADCFKSDLNNHIKYEPHHPYQLDFVSAKHLRGDNLSTREFVDHLVQRNDQLFLNNIKSQHRTVMRLNKTVIPQWGMHNPVINIIVDSAAKKWFWVSRYVKLFGQDDKGYISKENHPEFLAAKYKKVWFNNPYQFCMSKFSFLRRFVIGESAIMPFYNYNKLLESETNQHCDQYKINLSELLDPKQGVNIVISLFNQLNLGQPNIELLQWAHNYYYNTNVKPLEKN
jgi:hypothetical protein